MIQSFSIFNGNNFPESYLSKVFTLSSNLSYVAAPGTARHCYVETVTLRLARSQQNIVTERRCAFSTWSPSRAFSVIVNSSPAPPPPGGHAVAEQHVADDVPPHQPLPLLVTLQEADHQDGHAEENILLDSVKISTSVLKNICTCRARGAGCTGSTTWTRSARRRSPARR